MLEAFHAQRMRFAATAALAAAFPVVAPAPGDAAEPEFVWDEKLEVASGDAYRGPWRMNESEFLYVDDPTVAVNDDGLTAVVFADQAEQDVHLQIFEPGGGELFDAPVNVSRSPDIFSWLPRVAIGPGGGDEVYVLWQEIIFSGGSHGGDIYFARSNDGGETFSEPLDLSDSITGAGKGRLTERRWDNGSLDLAVSPDGDLYAAWTDYEGPLWVSRSTDGGESFSDPLHVAGDDEQPARGPSLAVGGERTVHLAWTVGEDEAGDIHFARSDDAARSFEEPRPVFESDGHSEAPKIAAGGEGVVHLVYGESPAGLFEHYHIRYARSLDGGEAFEEPREIADPEPQQLESMNFPDLSLDGDDNVYVSWELFPDRHYFPQGLGFAYSSDGGDTFTGPSVVPGSVDQELGFNGGQQGLLTRKLAVNESGDVVLVNSTFNRNEASHVWLFRARVEGR